MLIQARFQRPARLVPDPWRERAHRPWGPINSATPEVLGLTHDDEERICAQCGQDGILRSVTPGGAGEPSAAAEEVGAKSSGRRVKPLGSSVLSVFNNHEFSVIY